MQNLKSYSGHVRIVKVLSDRDQLNFDNFNFITFFLFELGSNSNLITLNFYSHFDFI